MSMRTWKKMTAAAVAMTAVSAAPAMAQVGEAVRDAGRAVGNAGRNAANAANNATNRAGNPTNRAGTRVRGTVVRVEGADQFLVRTNDGRQVTVYSTPETRYRFDDRDARFSDVRQGSDIDVGYTLRDEKFYAVDVTNPAAGTDPASPEPGAASRLRGTIRQPQQLVVRTSDGKDVTVSVETDQEFNLVVRQVGDKWFLASATTTNASDVNDEVRRDNAEPVRDGARRQPADAAPRTLPADPTPRTSTPRSNVEGTRDAVRDGREAVREGREATREARDEVRDAARENRRNND